MRPIGYKHADRVAAHILVYFHVFVRCKSLEMWQSRAGLGNSPRTVLEEFAHMHSQDIVLPTITRGHIRPRCFTQPEVAQAPLLDRLGITLPERMRLTEQKVPALAASGHPA